MLPSNRGASGMDNRDPGHASQLALLLPLYVVIFAGFAGYSLTITVFTPMLLRSDKPLFAASYPMHTRTIILGVLLCLYPFGQFIGSPIIGSFSDRFGRKPILLTSLAVTTACYALIAYSLGIRSWPLLVAGLLLAGLAEANIVTAQSAIADVCSPANRNRFFGYIYMSASAAYIIGPLVGGKLADPSIMPWFNYATPFWTVFFLLAITAAATAILFHETHSPGTGRLRFVKAFVGLADVFTNPR